MALRDKIFVTDLRVDCIVGINPVERVKRQNLIINLTLFYDIQQCADTDDIKYTVDYSTLSDRLCNFIENQSAYWTIESLSTAIARICCLEFGVEEVIVRIDKPAALMRARAPAIEVTRTRNYFLQPERRASHLAYNIPFAPHKVESSTPVSKDSSQVCYIALGSNIGDRADNIHKALAKVTEFSKLLETSFLYETAPQYISDQPAFLNAVAKVSTTLDPHQVLKKLQQIETDLGRQKVVKYGPRNIDLDILFYGNTTVSTTELSIPHPLIQERDFVLGPLLDICPEFVHPVLNKSIRQLYQELKLLTMTKVLPLGTTDSSIVKLGSRTLIMGVLNVTPDSFSDGGKFNNAESAVAHAMKLLEDGCDILDVGGQSTRPGATEISAEEEAARVIPVIKALKEKGFKAPISIDTFYSAVARQSVEAGASIVNDVTGGNHDSDMYETCAKLRVPLIMNHTRGNAQTMSSLAVYTDVVKEVRLALQMSAFRAQSQGMYRWHIVCDPGLGFAKHKEHSLAILKSGASLRELGFPLLYGPSKKGFLGGTGPADRSWRTAAAVTASVQQGADIVRVHDVAEMKQVVEVADSIYRQ